MNELQKLYALQKELKGQLWQHLSELLTELKAVATARAGTSDNQVIVSRATGAWLVTEQLLNLPSEIEVQIREELTKIKDEEDRKKEGK